MSGQTQGLGSVVRVILPVLALAAGAAGMVYLVKNRPVAAPRPPQPVEALVEVQAVAPADQPVTVSALGTVQADREVLLSARVAGDVARVAAHLRPGGRFAAGDDLLAIDSADHDLALVQRRADLARAESELALEQGRQEVARRELALGGAAADPRERDLILRVPQLRRLQAEAEAARAAVRRAELEVERCVVRAPFAGVVRERLVEVGARVSVQTPLLRLLGSERVLVRATLPVADLPRVRPGTAGVVVRQRGTGEWRGTVAEILGELESPGRLAQVLIEVADPLAEGRPPLLVGAAVELDIPGGTVPGAVAVARAHLRDGDAVHLMRADGTLEIRPVTVAWRSATTVLVTAGLAAGDRLVTTRIAGPVAGMALRLPGAPAPEKAGR